MPLLGKAVLLLSFDVAEEAIPEHDEWHTHEHLPERLSIPGFLRGSRWVASSANPRYFVMYEVDDLATLESAAYLARLNDPSPWTSKMMSSYRGMTRGFCSVSGSAGAGIGQVGLLVRLAPAAGRNAPLRAWLLDAVLPGLPARRGIGSAHLFEAVRTPPMTNEQRIRGADAGFGWAIFIAGYDEDALDAVARVDLGDARLGSQGARAISGAPYRMHYTLTDREVRP